MKVDSTGLVQVQLAPAPQGTGFTFEVPEQAALALRLGAGEASAQREDGSPLPDWLMFDRERLTFSAVAVPPGGLPIEVVVQTGALRVRIRIDR